MTIRTPDQRLRVFVSSTLGELAEERAAVKRAITSVGLTPIMFELGAPAYERATTLGGQMTRREAITLLAGSGEASSPA